LPAGRTERKSRRDRQEERARSPVRTVQHSLNVSRQDRQDRQAEVFSNVSRDVDENTRTPAQRYTRWRFVIS
jgi:hypothetical protein